MGLAAPCAAQWLMTSCARRWISGLPRCTESKSSPAALLPVAIELAAPPPMPMRMPGPPSCTSSVPAGKRNFSDQRGIDHAQTAGEHDGLVVAAHHGISAATHALLVFAKVARQIRAAEFVVERGSAQGAFEHDLQRAGNVPGSADLAAP